MHAFARQKCSELSGEQDDGNLISCMKAISNYYRGQKMNDAAKILSSLNKFLNILNEMRNDRSLAHPTSSMLESPESVLLINVSKLIMNLCLP